MELSNNRSNEVSVPTDLQESLENAINHEMRSLEACHHQWLAIQDKIKGLEKTRIEFAELVDKEKNSLAGVHKQCFETIEKVVGPFNREGFIMFNVSSRLFRVPRKVLCIEPLSVLASFCGSRAPSDELMIDNAFELERDPVSFASILNFLEYGIESLPANPFDLRLLYSESAFFVLPSLRDAIEDVLQNSTISELIKHYMSVEPSPFYCTPSIGLLFNHYLQNPIQTEEHPNADLLNSSIADINTSFVNMNLSMGVGHIGKSNLESSLTAENGQKGNLSDYSSLAPPSTSSKYYVGPAQTKRSDSTTRSRRFYSTVNNIVNMGIFLKRQINEEKSIDRGSSNAVPSQVDQDLEEISKLSTVVDPSTSDTKQIGDTINLSHDTTERTKLSSDNSSQPTSPKINPINTEGNGMTKEKYASPDTLTQKSLSIPQGGKAKDRAKDGRPVKVESSNKVNVKKEKGSVPKVSIVGPSKVDLSLNVPTPPQKKPAVAASTQKKKQTLSRRNSKGDDLSPPEKVLTNTTTTLPKSATLPSDSTKGSSSTSESKSPKQKVETEAVEMKPEHNDLILSPGFGSPSSWLTSTILHAVDRTPLRRVNDANSNSVQQSRGENILTSSMKTKDYQGSLSNHTNSDLLSALHQQSLLAHSPVSVIIGNVHRRVLEWDVDEAIADGRVPIVLYDIDKSNAAQTSSETKIEDRSSEQRRLSFSGKVPHDSPDNMFPYSKTNASQKSDRTMPLDSDVTCGLTSVEYVSGDWRNLYKTMEKSDKIYLNGEGSTSEDIINKRAMETALPDPFGFRKRPPTIN